MCFLFVSFAWSQTVIEFTDTVLVEDTVRFGINLGGDTYYSGAALVKNRSCENFEGTIYRQCHFGPSQDEQGATSWFRQPMWWQEMMIKHGHYEILSGPARGTRGKISQITTKKEMHNGKLEGFMYIRFDRQVPAGAANGGLLVEAFRTEDGQFRALDGFWSSKTNEIVTGDVAADSFGVAALKLKGSEGRAHFNLSTHYQRYGQLNGRWHVRFRAKRAGGAPTLSVIPSGAWGTSKSLEPDGIWREYDAVIVINKVPESAAPDRNHHLFIKIEATGGDVLIDDVELWMEGDANPTVFRDDLVALLKAYNPGMIRYLQTGGSTVANTIAPPLRSYSYSSRQGRAYGPYEGHQTDPYSLHELYELCAYVGAEPWYCLPGTLHKEELADFMEYLGAASEEGFGKMRARLGQEKPWTQVFNNIHVEFGNEAWNTAAWYQCGGYNGPDYWRELIDTGKGSKYYRANVLYHSAGQAAWSGRNEGIMKNAPNADRFSVAPYLVSNLNKSDLALCDTDRKLFQWVFAQGIWRSFDERGAMYQNAQLARQAGIELSIYEMNHHTTHGDAPLEPRNRIVASLGGGISVVNNMLLMLREHGLRSQCLFSLIQHSYRAHGIGSVYLWGTALNMRKGHERYRPTFLGCMIANKVIGGDLVKTVHSKDEPKFDARGYFAYKGDVETVEDIPTIWSYGFSEGKRRGLILVSLDVSDEQVVEVRFDGKVRAKAKSWLMSGDSITANNEFETGAPQVKVAHKEFEGFGSGSKLELPPHSMTVVEWQIR